VRQAGRSIAGTVVRGKAKAGRGSFWVYGAGDAGVHPKMISSEGRLGKWSQPWAWSIILLLVGASVFCVIFVGSGVLAGAVTGSTKCTRDGYVRSGVGTIKINDANVW